MQSFFKNIGEVNVLSCRPGELRNKKAWEVGVAWQVKDIAPLIAVAGLRGDSGMIGRGVGRPLPGIE